MTRSGNESETRTFSAFKTRKSVSVHSQIVLITAINI